MRTIITLLFAILLYSSCSYENISPIARTEIRLDTLPIWITVAGQSNAGIFTTTQLGTVKGINTFNCNKNRWEDSLDVTKQFIGGIGGFIVPLSRLLKEKYPHRKIYVTQYHVPGTGMDKWNIQTGLLFRNLLGILDQSLISFPESNYQRYFIWVQGEADASAYMSTALAYQKYEEDIFDYINRNYHPTKILDYRLPPFGTKFRDIVNEGKDSTARVIKNDHVIWSNKFEYRIDRVHMSLVGIQQFADSLITHIN